MFDQFWINSLIPGFKFFTTVARFFFSTKDSALLLHYMGSISTGRYESHREYNEAARFLWTDYRWTSSVISMTIDLGCKPLVENRREQRLVLLSKILNDLLSIPTEYHIGFNNRSSRTSNQIQLKILSIHCQTVQ